MPHECILSDCKSGRKTENEKVQLFQFPKETTKRNRWLRHCDLGKNIRNKDPRLCEKHFLPSCFLKPSENVDDQGRPRSLKRLRDGAVPTVFKFGPTPSPSKRRAHASTEVTPVPRKIPRIDHSYSSVNLPLPAGVSITVVNSENRFVDSPYHHFKCTYRISSYSFRP